jgi:hypothetical protein
MASVMNQSILDWLTLQKRIRDYADMQDRLIAVLDNIIYEAGYVGSDGYMDGVIHSENIYTAEVLIKEARRM